MAFRPLGVVLDLDGVFWVTGKLAPGAIRLVATLHELSIPFVVLTNDCTCNSAQRWSQLTDAGLILREEQVLTAAQVTRDWLIAQGVKRIQYLGRVEAIDDLRPLDVSNLTPVDAVLIGDPFDVYTRESLELASVNIQAGALFIAMQRKRNWHDGDVVHIDNGFWVAGLEYVTGVTASVVGKPSATAYEAALKRLEISASERNRVAMVSDDIDVDLDGAAAFGFETIHVGKAQSLPPWVNCSVGDLAAVEQLLRAAYAR